MKKTDVLIVGAGPSGLFLASLLSRCGVDFVIVDQNIEVVKESRALGIQARTLELLQNVDMVAPFIKAGLPAKGVAFFSNFKKRMSLDFKDIGRDDTPFPYIMFLPQSETEKFLVQDLKIRGVNVDRGQKLVRIEQDAELVKAKIQNGAGHITEISAKYAVGCDGSHSQVRKQLGLEFKGDAYGSEFIMADAKVNWEHPHDRLQVFFKDAAVGVFFPLKGESMSRVLALRQFEAGEQRPQTSETTSFPATLEEVQEGMRKSVGPGITLTDPVWVTRYHVHHRGVDKMQVGRIFVAGDAAHIHSPLGAQGMNTGLQDVANLGWKLAAVLKQSASPDLLETYHSERWPVAQHLLQFTDRVFSLVQSQSRLALFTRNRIVPILGKIIMNYRGGRRRIFNFVSQLGIRYHESLAVQGEKTSSARENVRPGHRMPNANLAKGQLFDLVKGYQFHLLVVSRKEIASDERKRLLRSWREFANLPRELKEIWLDRENPETSGGVFERLGVGNGAVLLVRPDGYIAYRAEF